MALKLYNTLTKQVTNFTPLNSEQVTIYSCGPTVYAHAHIGNLSSFIFADTLRRVITANNWTVHHAMNLTDVDDKTIRRSRETYPDLDGMTALKKLTNEYSELFMQDMRTIGNDIDALHFMHATDEPAIKGMQQLITELHQKGFAYVADDGVYFSIDAYKKSGKKYGQLVTLTEANTSAERIQNDEYDKESPHDFALWKAKKPGEPAWEFILDGHNIAGRPGWHIECSVMSRLSLGQPFDIHTGGIDLTFPHHENEIAQSTAAQDSPIYATLFVHNEHMLVDDKKMAKSSNNFYTLTDLVAKDIDPLSFRLFVLQSHYRKPTNFNLENVAAAHNRLRHWRNVAALRWQTYDTLQNDDDTSANHTIYLNAALGAMLEALNEDLNTPAALAIIDETFSKLMQKPLTRIHQHGLQQLLESIDSLLGLSLLDSTPDISDSTKQRILERERARDNKDWQRADELRKAIAEQGIIVRDTVNGSIWEYS